MKYELIDIEELNKLQQDIVSSMMKTLSTKERDKCRQQLKIIGKIKELIHPAEDLVEKAFDAGARALLSSSSPTSDKALEIFKNTYRPYQ